MRLGILGPALGDLGALARAASLLRTEYAADRVLYIGDDDALDRVVERWAREIVGADPSDAGVFERAAARCARAKPPEIDAFVAKERARLDLVAFTALEPGSRTIELLDGRVVLFVHDKATLDEEDILAASILVFGKSDAALVRKVGTRIFLSPGPLTDPQGGCALLDDGDGGVRVDVIASNGGAVVLTEQVGSARASKMHIQGGHG
ncbi:MAG TPA: hypothetical protein VGM56_20660 [Byssovorax sp.]|jgi:hypothetical protein